jgi:hypothetical protein
MLIDPGQARATIFRVTKERWAQIGITTEFHRRQTLSEFFRPQARPWHELSTAVAAPISGRFDRSLLLLAGVTFYSSDAICCPPDHASDHTRSAGVQNCRDRLVVAARSDDESEIAQTGSGQLSNGDIATGALRLGHDERNRDFATKTESIIRNYRSAARVG